MSNYKDNTYNGESVSNGCTQLQTIIIIDKITYGVVVINYAVE